jgi:hypothetical protein
LTKSESALQVRREAFVANSIKSFSNARTSASDVSVRLVSHLQLFRYIIKINDIAINPCNFTDFEIPGF